MVSGPTDMVKALEQEPLSHEATASDVALAASGDRHAFERLYHSHVNRVYSVCARMVRDRSAAEELTQDVFVRAWEKLSLFRGDAAFGTWLHRLAVNVVLNAKKSESRRQARQADDEGEIDALPQRSNASVPGASIDLETAMATLPKGARQIFVLHDVEGFKHEEIADMLHITSGGSKAQLHRARLLLRKVLTQ